MEQKKANWRMEVFRIALPLCLSYIPIGFACGILLHAVGFNFGLAGLLSLLVFSGGGQFLIASMLSIQAPLTTVIMMLLFLELRYTLLGASISPFMRQEKRGFLAFFSSSMNDENYAINYFKFATDANWNPQKAIFVNHLSLLFWTVSNMLGTLFGDFISIDVYIIDFALTAMFAYMVIMQLKNRLTIFIGLFSGILAIGLMMLFKNTFGLILATLIASFAGFLIEHVLENKKSYRRWWVHQKFNKLPKIKAKSQDSEELNDDRL